MEAELAQARELKVQILRGQHQYHRVVTLAGPAGLALGEHAARDLRSVHPGHAVVEQHQAVRTTRRAGPREFGQPGLAASGFARLRRAGPRERLAQDEPVGLVVVDDQDAHAVELGRDRMLREGRMRVHGERNRNPKGRAAAGCAFDLDRAVHQPGQPGHDGEAEAGAAEAARDGCVGLAEAAEDRVELVGGDADAGVGNREAQPAGRTSLDAGAPQPGEACASGLRPSARLRPAR